MFFIKNYKHKIKPMKKFLQNLTNTDSLKIIQSN